MSDKLISVKFADGKADRLKILAIPLGGFVNGSDLDGERFTKNTDLCLDWFPGSRPLLYDHGHDGKIKTSVVGYFDAKSIAFVEDEGWWIEAQLSKSSRYFDAIGKLVDQKKMYSSSGSVGHLVQKSKNGDIEVWPWIEQSLTVSPANLFARVEPAEVAKHYKSADLGIGLVETAPDEIKETLLGDLEDLWDEVDAILEEGKAVLSTGTRNKLPDSAFAYITSDGKRKLPINDEAHARNALARFEKTKFESTAKKKAAARKIRAACRKFGIDISDDSAVAQTAKSFDDLLELAEKSEDLELLEALKALNISSDSAGGALTTEDSTIKKAIAKKPATSSTDTDDEDEGDDDKDKEKQKKDADLSTLLQALAEDPEAVKAFLDARQSASTSSKKTLEGVYALRTDEGVLLLTPSKSSKTEATEAVKAGEVVVQGSRYGEAPEGSVEDWLQDLRRCLNRSMGFGGFFDSPGYVELITTFGCNSAGYCMVCVHSYDDDCEDAYYKVDFDVQDGEPTLTGQTQYASVFIPMDQVPANAVGADDDDMGKSVEPLIHNFKFSILASDVVLRRTKDVKARRAGEGRDLSSANQEMLIKARAASKALTDAFDALLASPDKTDAKVSDTARLQAKAKALALEIEVSKLLEDIKS